MDKDLYKATIQGNLESLLELIQTDPLILDRSIATCYGETPLHISALRGHKTFSIELLNRKPEFAAELDLQGSTPLHLAAAKGNLELVKALLMINQDACFIRDKHGRYPFHVAAVKGRIGVLKELLATESEAVRVLASRGQTILHLCVEYCQLETLMFLMGNLDVQGLINWKDYNGNSILQLAVAHKQIETINYLLGNTKIEVNSLNAYGLTAVDILAQTRRSDKEDIHILESLQNAGATKANEPASSTRSNQSTTTYSSLSSSLIGSNGGYNNDPMSWQQYLNKQDEWLEKKRDVLMVVASLIAGMGFAAGMSPPAGLLANEDDDMY